MCDLEYREQRRKEKIQQHESSDETADYAPPRAFSKSQRVAWAPACCFGTIMTWFYDTNWTFFDDLRSLTDMALCLPVSGMPELQTMRSEWNIPELRICWERLSRPGVLKVNEEKVVMNEGLPPGEWDSMTIAKSLRRARKQRRKNVRRVMPVLERYTSSSRIVHLEYAGESTIPNAYSFLRLSTRILHAHVFTILTHKSHMI